MSTGAFTRLTEGDVIGGILFGFTDVMGSWFYFLIIIALLFTIQFKTQQMEVTAIAMMMLSGAGIVLEYLPAVSGGSGINMIIIYAFMMIAGLTLIFWKNFVRRDRF